MSNILIKGTLGKIRNQYNLPHDFGIDMICEAIMSQHGHRFNLSIERIDSRSKYDKDIYIIKKEYV